MSAFETTACDERLPLLVDAAEGILDAEARAGLDAHLVDCAGCRAELDELRETTALLAATRHEPDALHVAGFAVRTTDAAERFRDRSVRGFWWALPVPQRLAAFFSAAALAASVALFVAARPDTRPATDPSAGALASADRAVEPTLFELLEDDGLAFDGSFADDPFAMDPFAVEDVAFDRLASLGASSGWVDLDTGFDTLDDEDIDALIELLETT